MPRSFPGIGPRTRASFDGTTKPAPPPEARSAAGRRRREACPEGQSVRLPPNPTGVLPRAPGLKCPKPQNHGSQPGEGQGRHIQDAFGVHSGLLKPGPQAEEARPHQGLRRSPCPKRYWPGRCHRRRPTPRTCAAPTASNRRPSPAPRAPSCPDPWPSGGRWHHAGPLLLAFRASSGSRAHAA